MDFTEGPTPYEVLGLKQDATEAEIRKAYKMLALKKHPDKNRQNPNAAAEFNTMEAAYRVLMDANARGALDDFLGAKQARVERQSQESEKRKRYREDLERREKNVAEVNEQQSTRQRFQKELERLRKKAADEEEAAAQAAAAAAQAKAAAAATPGDRFGGAVDNETNRCSLKVTWDADVRDYACDDLREIFSAHGIVTDAFKPERKSKGRGGRSKGKALVVMSTWQEADRAAHAVCGDVTAPLLVVPLLKVAPTRSPDLDGLDQPAARHTRTTSSPAPPSPMHAAFPAQATPQAGPTFPIFPTTSRPAVPTSAASLFPVGGAASKPLFGVGTQPGLQGPGTAASSFPVGATTSSFPGVAPAGSTATGGFSSFAGVGAAGASGHGMSSAENAILQKMKRAAEREKALAAARAEAGEG